MPAATVDVLNVDRHEAAHRTLRDAEEYLDRITEQYGPDHDETRYAAQLVADARTAHEHTSCHWAFMTYTLTSTAIPEALTAAVNETIDAAAHAAGIPADLIRDGAGE